MLGQSYANGTCTGVDQSYQRAKELYDVAASQGMADAQYNLGCMYKKGHDVD